MGTGAVSRGGPSRGRLLHRARHGQPRRQAEHGPGGRAQAELHRAGPLPVSDRDGQQLRLGRVCSRAGSRAGQRRRCADLRREQQQARAQGRLVGIGLASYVEICGFEDDETSDVVVGDDGKVSVMTGRLSHGQGHETAFAQLVADELQVPMADVTVIQGDTVKVRAAWAPSAAAPSPRAACALGNAVKVREQAITGGGRAPRGGGGRRHRPRRRQVLRARRA